MPDREILNKDGLKLELVEIGELAMLSIAWDDNPDHRIVGIADEDAMFSVLNGVRYEISADRWICAIELDQGSVRFNVRADEFEILDCAFTKREYENAIIHAFTHIRQTHAA